MCSNINPQNKEDLPEFIGKRFIEYFDCGCSLICRHTERDFYFHDLYVVYWKVFKLAVLCIDDAE